jgi:DNA-binding IclR family transcriptional regulator
MAATEQKKSARRALRVLWILQGNTFEGLRLKHIAEHLMTTQSTALRDLEMLAEEGVAERIPGRDEFWRLTPKLIQLARAHDEEMNRLRRRIEETDQRYTRSPL